jgi:hypothetical protein
MNPSNIILDVSTILPAYVERLPFTIKVGWLKVYNLGLDQYGEKHALSMANLWALRKLDEHMATPEEDFADQIISKLVEPEVVEQEETEIIAQSKEAKEFVSFTLQPKDIEMVSMSEDGDIVIDAVLADNNYNSAGKRFTDEALISMAEQINNKGMALPDIAHEEYDKLLETTATAEEFKKRLKEKKGLLTRVKAFYEDGKLFIKAFLDKRYKRHTQIYKNLSIEAHVPMNRQKDDTYMWAEPLSFTFTNNPKIAGAEILSVN